MPPHFSAPALQPVWEEVGRALSDAHIVQLTIDKKVGKRGRGVRSTRSYMCFHAFLQSIHAMRPTQCLCRDDNPHTLPTFIPLPRTT